MVFWVVCVWMGCVMCGDMSDLIWWCFCEVCVDLVLCLVRYRVLQGCCAGAMWAPKVTGVLVSLCCWLCLLPVR